MKTLQRIFPIFLLVFLSGLLLYTFFSGNQWHEAFLTELKERDWFQQASEIVRHLQNSHTGEAQIKTSLAQFRVNLQDQLRHRPIGMKSFRQFLGRHIPGCYHTSPETMYLFHRAQNEAFKYFSASKRGAGKGRMLASLLRFAVCRECGAGKLSSKPRTILSCLSRIR